MTSNWIRSNVLGLIAIFIALSGTAVAAQAGGDHGLKAKTAKAKKGPRGPAGPPGPPGPATGAAGGALTGNYPNPGLAGNSVGSGNLKGTYAAVSPGTDPGSTFTLQTASCNPGDRVLGGGYSWDEENGTFVEFSTPDTLVNPNKWVVKGQSPSSTTNTLRAWALCLTA